MQQVLEAPQIQDEARKPIAIDNGGSAAKQTQPPVTLLRSVMSVFVQPRPQHIPAGADTVIPHESALDRISRIDPYLYIRSLAG